MSGPGAASIDHASILQSLKSQNSNLVIVDFTHPSAILSNLEAYRAADCNFVMVSHIFLKYFPLL